MATVPSTTNRLAREKSPYLLQHAHNPVDWYPWGDEAFAMASKTNRPVFLSVGYSTCHWCHVMERESFEDEEVAQVLNEHFISIKVDREERPDIDHIYMAACQAMTGQGGWPLTVIMTPDKKPFFAGTYFPKHAKWGRPGLMEILQLVAEKWRSEPNALLEAGESITRHLQTSPASPGQSASDMALSAMPQRGFQMFDRSFDRQYGGFGQAPKFPTPHNIMFLLRYWRQTGTASALEMAEKTLQSMYRGGIYDHIGFGFSRYSTDQKWLVPHFEKMLYDNALLALAYLEAYQATGKQLYATVAKQIFTYVRRDMTSPQGGFYSAEDADSEGEEGKFYVWTPAELEQVLGAQQARIYGRVYDITDQGNFEGFSIPNLIGGMVPEQAGELGLAAPELQEILEQCRRKLFPYREKRVHPHKDDKVLTAWNGLMIAALARGAAVLGDEGYLVAAEQAVAFIRRHLFDRDGRLLARYREGEAAFPAYLDDYAFFILGLIELYQASFKPQHLSLALDLTGQVRELFLDQDQGGFFFYGSDAEQLLYRPKEIYDGAMPAGNSVMALNLLQLAAITGDNDLALLGEKQIKTLAAMVDYPMGHAYFLMAALFYLHPVAKITIAGDPDDPEVQAMLRLARQGYRPDAILIHHGTGEDGEQIRALAPATRDQMALEGRATAYVCQDLTCHPPVQDPGALQEMLQTTQDN